MTSALAFTRSIALRRASSSPARISPCRRTSSGVASRFTRRVGGAPNRPCGTFAERCSASAPTAWTRPRSSPRSASTITAAARAGTSSASQKKNSLRLPLNATSTRTATLLDVLPHPQELFAAAAGELVRLEPAEVVELAQEHFLERGGGDLVIGVRSPRRLGDDLVDHAQLEQVGRRDAE